MTKSSKSHRGIRKHNLPCIPSIFPCCLHHLYMKAWENPRKTEIIRGSPVSSVVHQTVDLGGSCPTRWILSHKAPSASEPSGWVLFDPPATSFSVGLFSALKEISLYQSSKSSWDASGNGPAQPGGQEWPLWTPQCDHRGNPALDVSLHFMCDVYLAEA